MYDISGTERDRIEELKVKRKRPRKMSLGFNYSCTRACDVCTYHHDASRYDNYKFRLDLGKVLYTKTSCSWVNGNYSGNCARDCMRASERKSEWKKKCARDAWEWESERKVDAPGRGSRERSLSPPLPPPSPFLALALESRTLLSSSVTNRLIVEREKSDTDRRWLFML